MGSVHSDKVLTFLVPRPPCRTFSAALQMPGHLDLGSSGQSSCLGSRPPGGACCGEGQRGHGSQERQEPLCRAAGPGAALSGTLGSGAFRPAGRAEASGLVSEIHPVVLRVHKKAFGDRSAMTRFEASTVLAVSDPPCPAGVPGGWLGSCRSSQSVPTVSFVTWQRQSCTQEYPMALVSVFMHLRW